MSYLDDYICSSVCSSASSYIHVCLILAMQEGDVYRADHVHCVWWSTGKERALIYNIHIPCVVLYI